jgi:hypothetical protein
MGDLHDRNGDNVVSGPIGYFSTEYECLEAMLLAYGPGRVFPPDFLVCRQIPNTFYSNPHRCPTTLEASPAGLQPF